MKNDNLTDIAHHQITLRWMNFCFVAAPYGRCEHATERTPSPQATPASNNRDSHSSRFALLLPYIVCDLISSEGAPGKPTVVRICATAFFTYFPTAHCTGHVTRCTVAELMLITTQKPYTQTRSKPGQQPWEGQPGNCPSKI